MDFTRLTIEPQILFRKKDRQLYSGGYFTPLGKNRLSLFTCTNKTALQYTDLNTMSRIRGQASKTSVIVYCKVIFPGSNLKYLK
jgi:hypothetical protein